MEGREGNAGAAWKRPRALYDLDKGATGRARESDEGRRENVDDAKVKALLGASAETLTGVMKAFDDCEAQCEPAWR